MKSNGYTQIKQMITGAPPYYKIHVKFKIVKFGRWNSKGVTVTAASATCSEKFYLKVPDLPDDDNICGVSKSHKTYAYFFITDIYDSDFWLFYNLQDDNNFGIKDITVSLLLCPSRCLKCTGPTYAQCTQCITNSDLPNCLCSSGFFLVPCGTTNSGGVCIDKCQRCVLPCVTCTSSTACTSCSQGYNLIGITCKIVSGCNPGYYFVTYDYSCRPCAPSCSTCVSDNECTSCTNGEYLQENGQCIQLCPDDTYPDLSTSIKKCISCSSTCATCSGPTDTDCKSCLSPNILYLSTCYSKCPIQTYFSSPTCIPCDTTCAECSGSNADQCLSCSGSLYLSGTECVSTCQGGTYLEDQICMACDPLCAACSGSAKTQCDSCTPGLNRVLQGNECVCDTGYFENSVGTCDICDPTCKTCVDNDKKCTSCDAPLIMNSDACVPCPARTYFDPSVPLCKNCHPTCVSCQGPSANQCDSCSSEKNFVNGNTCECFTGDFFNAGSKLCEACDKSCLNCLDSATNCIACPAGSKFLNNKCYNCQTGTFFDSSLPGCVKCDISCLTCYGKEINNCVTCSPDKVFTPENFCVCNATSFLNQQNLCVKCNVSCLTCELNTNNCTSCTSDKVLSNNTCICPAASYYDVPSDLCRKCDATCSKCIGSSQLDCTACVDAQACLLNGECLSKCPEGYYNDSKKNCRACGSFCKECESNSVCLNCYSGYALIGNVCVKQKNLTVTYKTIQNPTAFKLNFSVYWQELIDGLERYMELRINDFSSKNFTYKLTKEKTTTVIELNFLSPLKDNSYQLDIIFNIGNTSEYILLNKELKIPLNSYIVCPDNSFYNTSIYNKIK